MITPESVKEMLSSEDLGNRLRAVNQIRELEDRAIAFELATSAISDRNARVRYSAVSQMDTLGGQNLTTSLNLLRDRLLNDPEPDVQAASRVADEKRRRNAGASARFRQRRKEKEKEASTTIGRLEQQVKELSEDADFYRRERDMFRGILSTIPGSERHLQRPPSPRLRRSSIVSIPGHSGSSTIGEQVPSQEQAQRSPEGRNVRRRTSTFSLPPPPPPAAQHISVPNAPYQPNFGPSTYGAPLAAQPVPAQPRSSELLPPSLGRGQIAHSQLPAGNRPPQPLPPTTMHQPQHHHGPPPTVLQPNPQQSGPWNPYPSDRRPSVPEHTYQDTRKVKYIAVQPGIQAGDN